MPENAARCCTAHSDCGAAMRVGGGASRRLAARRAVESAPGRGETGMLYMVIEHFNPGAAPEIYRRARDRGRLLPAGLEYIDSWVDLEYSRCFQLMRTEDRSLFEPWVEAWSDLGRFEIVAVRTSADAARHIADRL
jgi:hypothetical protein